MVGLSVGDIEGPWVDPEFNSGLIEQCKRYWSTPIGELPDLMIATYLTQDFAAQQVAAEAQKRANAGTSDGSVLYEGQLSEALRSYIERRRPPRKLGTMHGTV